MSFSLSAAGLSAFPLVLTFRTATIYSDSLMCSKPDSTYKRVYGWRVGGVSAEVKMFLFIALLLLILWAGGFMMFHVASGLIHLLLLFAVSRLWCIW